MNMQVLEKNKIISYFLFILFVLLFIAKYKYFAELFPRIDQSFYIKWIIDLGNSKSLFPSGDKGFYLNLLSDSNSLLHNFFRRIYNDVGVIYNLIPISFNLIFSKITNYNYFTFNTLSIFFNCLIPLAITMYLIKKKDLSTKYLLYLSTFNFFFIISFFSIFYLAPLGIHNYSLLSLIISIIVFESNLKNEFFLNRWVIFFGILIPCFSHKFNIVIVFSSIFLILFYRYFNRYKFKQDFVISICLFFLVLSPILFFSFFGERNIELLKIFFSITDQESSKNFISIISKYLNSHLTHSFRNFFLYLWNNLGFFGIILILTCLFDKKFSVIKVYIFATFLIFIFLPLSPYIDRLFNYFLILSIFLISQNSFKFFNGVTKKDKLMKILFILTIFVNLVPIFFNNLQNDFQRKIVDRYPYNKIWKNKLDKIIKIVGDDQIVFYQYLARDVYYAEYNRIDKYKEVYSTPSVYDLSNKYLNQNFDYIKNISFDKNKFKNTYVLYFGDTTFEKNLTERFCYLQKKFFNSCGNLEIVNYSDHNKPLKYQGATHNYVLNLYKSLN